MIVKALDNSAADGHNFRINHQGDYVLAILTCGFLSPFRGSYEVD